MTPAIGLGLILLAVLAGLDLVSLLQGLLSRPLVVGAGSGLLLGDVETGLRVGAVLELFALDVVPVGAARYPDFGAAAVAAVMYASGTAWPASLGTAAGFGLLLSMAAGSTIPLARRWNARAVERRAIALAQGDAAVVNRLQLTCLGHDLARSVALAVLALGLALALRAAGIRPDVELGRWLTAVVVGGGVWAAVHGAVVSARTGGRARWAATGFGLGVLGVLA